MVFAHNLKIDVHFAHILGNRKTKERVSCMRKEHIAIAKMSAIVVHFAPDGLLLLRCARLNQENL